MGCLCERMVRTRWKVGESAHVQHSQMLIPEGGGGSVAGLKHWAFDRLLCR